eukprot:4160432-Prymnesium_polylepis.1
MPTDVSWKAKLIAVASTARHAASAIGPSGQCGASDTSYASAMRAIVRSGEIPPQWELCTGGGHCEHRR